MTPNAGEEFSGEMMKQTVEVEQLPRQGFLGDSGLNVRSWESSQHEASLCVSVCLWWQTSPVNHLSFSWFHLVAASCFSKQVSPLQIWIATQ